MSNTARDAPAGRPQAASTVLASRNRFTRRLGSGASPPHPRPSKPGAAHRKNLAARATALVRRAGVALRKAAIPSSLPTVILLQHVRFQPTSSCGHFAIRFAPWQPRIYTAISPLIRRAQQFPMSQVFDGRAHILRHLAFVHRQAVNEFGISVDAKFALCVANISAGVSFDFG